MSGFKVSVDSENKELINDLRKTLGRKYRVVEQSKTNNTEIHFIDCIGRDKCRQVEGAYSIAILEGERETDFSAAENLYKEGFAEVVYYPFRKLRLRKLIERFRDEIYTRNQLNRVFEIGIELSSERNLEKLLRKIVKTARDFTNGDACSIYVVTREKDEELNTGMLEFMISEGDTLKESYERFKIPITSNSIAGYVALTKQALNLSDCYNIPEDSEFTFYDTYDKLYNYHTKSMLTVPMLNREGEVIGIVQLINRKKHRETKLINKAVTNREVRPFRKDSIQLIDALASQAAVCIENAMLYREIEELLESFIEASALAVDSREPSTAGHSRRVAELVVKIAAAVDAEKTGPLAGYSFNADELKQLRYAGLLHDFGKIGVPEAILLKAEKLYPWELERIMARSACARFSTLLNIHSEEKRQEILKELDLFEKTVRKVNIPIPSRAEDINFLKKMRKKRFTDSAGREMTLLNDNELEMLSIEFGSLSPEERKAIMSHVEHTYRFLKEIKWTSDFARIPEIALNHHEKLDGSGYPNGRRASEIPIESQIMCIADIYDALIASDRPYKNRLPVEKALAILKYDAMDGKLNQDMVELFISKKLYSIDNPSSDNPNNFPQSQTQANRGDQ
ncbi:MAG: HD family phosphohydrolase [Spirochaetes bacterium]|nr:MAG: HD family phosphohydrolase [Spirochaetota bacterium]